jgi:hypothetical protein
MLRSSSEAAFSSAATLAQRWTPSQPEHRDAVVRLKEANALASGEEGAVLAATAYGLGRWHPKRPARLLPWPQPMALNNHRIVIA